MTRKSRKLRSSFCEVDYVFRLPVLHQAVVLVFRRTIYYHGTPVVVDQGFISRKLSVIGMKVSFRNFASQFISYCVLIQKS